MKIIGIVGVIDLRGSDDRVWKHLRDAFQSEFPDARFVVEHTLYWPWERRKMRLFADTILKKHDTGEDIFLLGWSMGGIIACVIAPRFKKSPIVGIATIGAPHRIPIFYKMLGSSIQHPLPARLVTFSGVFDPVVWWFLTWRHDGEHTRLWSDHLFAFIKSSRFANAVARKAKLLFPSKRWSPQR